MTTETADGFVHPFDQMGAGEPSEAGTGEVVTPEADAGAASVGMGTANTPAEPAATGGAGEIEPADGEATVGEGGHIPVSRFNKIYYRMKAAERQLNEMQDRSPQSQGQGQAQGYGAPAPQGAQAERPTLASVDFDESRYQEALINWQVEQRMSDLQRQQEQTAHAAQVQQEHQQIVNGFEQRAQQYALNNPEYDATLKMAEAAGFQFTDGVTRAILQSEAGPQIQHHLLSNPEMAAELNSADPYVAAMRIGQLETQFKGAAQAAAPKPSQAPAPLDTVGGSAPRMGKERLADPDLSMADFMSLFNG